MRKITSWLLIVGLLPYLTGCESMPDYPMTVWLWGGDFASGHHEQARPPNLRLYQAQDQREVLVQYDEVNGENVGVKRRAYLLHANESKIDAGKKPRFLKSPRTETLPVILINTNAIIASSVTNQSVMQANVSSDGREFTLISGGRELGPYRLPVYLNVGTQTERVVLTPLAVTGDVVIAAAVLGAVAGLVYLVARADSGSN